jgi:hypothetical protein
MDNVITAMVKKTLDLHLLPNLAFAAIVYASFDLWISRDSIDIFALVIKILNESWTPMHVTMAYLRLMKQVGRIWLFNLNHYLQSLG